MELLLLFLENFFILTILNWIIILNGIINLNCNNLRNKLVILSLCLPPNMHTELYLPPSHLASNQVTRLSPLTSAGGKKQFQWTGSSLPTLIRSNHYCYLSLYTVDDRRRSLILPPTETQAPTPCTCTSPNPPPHRTRSGWQVNQPLRYISILGGIV